MSESNHDSIAVFKENAAKVSTTVVELKNLNEAIDYALGLYTNKDKVFAAPNLPAEAATKLKEKAEAAGAKLALANLRECLKDIAVGITLGDMAISDTASVIMSNEKEDPRLASMLSEIHVIAVPKSKIVADSYEAEDYLRNVLSSPMYTTFISGCSRTSDIERVLTLGVHGPLELHVALLEEE